MKNYLIIGGSSGIGLQLTHTLAKKNHTVYATYYQKETHSDTDNIHYHPLNVLNETDFSYLPDKLHGLIYCVGNIYLKQFSQLKIEEFQRDYDLQVIGAIKCIQACLPRLKACKHSSIVLFSTISVQMGFDFHSLVSSSKGAIEGLCRALAAEFAPDIRVNCIAPSLTDTPMADRLLRTDKQKETQAQSNPLKRIGHVQDSANMANFLLSEKSDWITGQIIHVDGGMSALR
ncbi:MAG: SDR family NAD(P)-dependent oxidoreductase [Hyphomicrobiales bacterium]